MHSFSVVLITLTVFNNEKGLIRQLHLIWNTAAGIFSQTWRMDRITPDWQLDSCFPSAKELILKYCCWSVKHQIFWGVTDLPDILQHLDQVCFLSPNLNSEKLLSVPYICTKLPVRCKKPTAFLNQEFSLFCFCCCIWFELTKLKDFNTVLFYTIKYALFYCYC